MRERYNLLVEDINNEFNLLRNQKRYEFFTGEDFEYEDAEDWLHDVYEVRNDMTGGVYEAYVLSVDGDGIHIAEFEDHDNQYCIGFNDLASILDKIGLIEEMRKL